MRVYKKNFYLKWLRTPKKTQKISYLRPTNQKGCGGGATPQPRNNGKQQTLQTLPTDISPH